jgi:hypothetical protein
MEETNIITTEDWFQSLTDDIRSAWTEGVYQSRWLLIETMSVVGKRILEEKGKVKNIRELCNTVANSIGKSESTIYKAVEFAEKYPDLEKLPEGKNISWHKIVNLYLAPPKEVCEHKGDFSVVYITKYRCDECQKLFEKKPEEAKVSRQEYKFALEDYNKVLSAYMRLRKIELKGKEFDPVQQDIKTMFISERTPEEIIGCMEWLAKGDEEWKENWVISTVKKKISFYLGNKDKAPDVGKY